MKQNNEIQYLNILNDILVNGVRKVDRTGTGTIAVFGRQMRFNLRNDSFPLLTTKKMSIKSILAELLWFLEGSTDNNRLHELGATIWDEWALDNGELGPIYGYQWRNWEVPNNVELASKIEEIKAALATGTDRMEVISMVDELSKTAGKKSTVDQISEIIHQLKTKPHSRRIIVSAWNVADLPDESISPQDNVRNGKMALAPCHTLFQFYTRELTFEERLYIFGEHGATSGVISVNEVFEEYRRRYMDIINDCGGVITDGIRENISDLMDDASIPKHELSCQLYMRSIDFPLGAPYNIASYSLLTRMVAQCVNMTAGEFILTTGDTHIYTNQVEGVLEQLKRKPFRGPKLRINPRVKNIFDFRHEDFELQYYTSHPSIKFPISI